MQRVGGPSGGRPLGALHIGRGRALGLGYEGGDGQGSGTVLGRPAGGRHLPGLVVRRWVPYSCQKCLKDVEDEPSTQKHDGHFNDECEIRACTDRQTL